MISLHGHADHAAQTQNFLDKHIKVYVPHKDLSWFGDNIPQGTLDPQEGDKFDLGNTVLTAYAVPGHTVGSLVLLDAKTGDLYSSDSLGSNEPPRAPTPDCWTTWGWNAPWTGITRPWWT